MTLRPKSALSAMSFWMVGKTEAPPKAKRMEAKPRAKEKTVGLV